MNKALFLDRDGVINKDHHYVNQIEDFEFMDGIFELCKKYQDLGYLIIVCTNQGGISKGYYKETDLIEISKYMTDVFKSKGIIISKVYYEISMENNHPRRKPNPGMFLDAINEFQIDPSKSLMVGDKTSDLIAAYRAGIKENYFIKGKYPVETANFQFKIVDSLREV